MTPTPLRFDETIAHHYEADLGPFVFEPFARDLAARLEVSTAPQVLELACGTGRLTRHLMAQLPPTAHLTATDLDAGMLAQARALLPTAPATWATADMTALPYHANAFDRVACQFGVMFAPDKARAFAEMHRVLRPGGQLVFNTWGPLAENPVWAIVSEVVGKFFGPVPTPQPFVQGPFSMQDEQAVLAGLAQAGFRDATVVAVRKTGYASTARAAARGFGLGTPLRSLVQQHEPARLPALLAALEAALKARLGYEPLASPLHAWAFTARK